MLKKAYFKFNTLLVLVAFLCAATSKTSAAPNFYPFSPVKKEKKAEPGFNPAYYNPIINDRIIVSIFDILEQDAKETKNKKQVQEKKNNSFFSFKKQNETPKENQKSTVVLPKLNEDLDKAVLYNQSEKKETPKEQTNSSTDQEEQTILINFNNVSIIEFLRFISRVSNQNFIFDENDLQFNVTIVSEEPTTIENVLTALYQELRIHNLELIEQGNNMIIHKNPRVNSISRVVTDTLPEVAKQKDTEIVTRVFSLNTLEPDKAATIIRPLTSQQAIIEPVVNPNTLIVTDLVTNIEHISQLLKSLDSPNSGLVIGQYAVTSMTVSNIQRLTQEIMGPIAQGQTLILVPHSTARSIFVIGPPYLVERTLLMMKYVDQSEATTQIHDLEKMKGTSGGQGQWKLDENGNWIFSPASSVVTRTAVQNDEILYRLLEKDKLDRDLTPSDEYFLDQLKRKNALKVLGRDLSSNEALLMEQVEGQLRSDELSRILTPQEMEILKKLQEALLTGELQRELTPDEIAILKKLEKQYLEGDLDRDLTPEEIFFKNKFVDRDRDLELERLSPPRGKWFIDDSGKWHFLPEGSPDFGLLSPKVLGRDVAPEGMWEQDLDGKWRFKLGPGGKITAKGVSPKREMSEEIPFGTVEGTKFMMHKLQNRQGDEIVYALENIAYSLQSCGNVNQELICTINSVQWIESSNSLIFTGTPSSLEKVKELVKEIDAPARQVFIEMLILETTIDDALTYGVNWASRFGGGDVAGAQAFNTAGNPLTSAMDTTGSNLAPSSVGLARQSGFSQGVIGQTLSKDGVLFRSIGALVRAVHNRTDTRIVMNPKLLVEDNQEAEIFVGINTSFKTQSIANDQGRFLTNNIEYRDVGTTLRITPMIGNNDVITLDIFQESSSVLPGQGTGGGGGGGGGGGNNNNTATEDIGPTTKVNKTITRVHIPDRYFLVISGMMQDDNTVIRAQVPCLGGVPVIGGLFGERTHNDAKRNLMIFIRPQIIDTVEEIQHLTKHQQDIYKIQDSLQKSWKYGVEEALDFLNIPELCRPCCADEFVPQTY